MSNVPRKQHQWLPLWLFARASLSAAGCWSAAVPEAGFLTKHPLVPRKTFVRTYFDITLIECDIKCKTEGATGSASVSQDTKLLNFALAKLVALFSTGC